MTQGELFPAMPLEVHLRCRKALRSDETSLCAKAVLEVVYRCIGRDAAITIAAMQSYWRMRGLKVWGDRDVKAAVRGVPVGSARGINPGYFLCCEPEDVDAAERPLIAEIKSLARRLRAINAKSEISRMLCGQMGIE